MTKAYEFYIAGVQFHKAKEVINNLNMNGLIELIPEPTNEYDSNAIAIKYHQSPFESDNPTGTMLGYVPRRLSAEITAFIEINGLNNVCCDFIEINKDKKPWEQLKVRIYHIDQDEYDSCTEGEL